MSGVIASSDLHGPPGVPNPGSTAGDPVSAPNTAPLLLWTADAAFPNARVLAAGGAVSLAPLDGAEVVSVTLPPGGGSGTTWYNGATDPDLSANNPGTDLDYYLNTASGEIWQKQAGAWVSIGSLLGPDGAPSPGAAPTGSAGGDLSGSYPDPTVYTVGGVVPGDIIAHNAAEFDAAGSATAAQAASLQKSSNLSDLPSAATARTNLGLGTAATANLPAAGTNASASQAVRGDDTRLTGGTGGGTGGGPSALAADTDVAIASPQDGQVLTYSATAGKWVNAAPTTYTYNQPAASDAWHIAHGLDKFPSVTIVDTAGDVVIGDIAFVDANNVTLTFSAPFAGTAYLN